MSIPFFILRYHGFSDFSAFSREDYVFCCRRGVFLYQFCRIPYCNAVVRHIEIHECARGNQAVVAYSHSAYDDGIGCHEDIVADFWHPGILALSISHQAPLSDIEIVSDLSFRIDNYGSEVGYFQTFAYFCPDRNLNTRNYFCNMVERIVDNFPENGSARRSPAEKMSKSVSRSEEEISQPYSELARALALISVEIFFR